jgi:hypothetical protein
MHILCAKGYFINSIINDTTYHLPFLWAGNPVLTIDSTHIFSCLFTRQSVCKEVVFHDASPDETVLFSWILFESKEHRDEANAAVMADPRMSALMPADSEELFDNLRMAYGGFKTLVDLIDL